ncbi:class I SAM-dependent methyltransferase [Sulfurimonas sp. MAG313]|nr:class I SAM-dependent methyltransferase [Sulfurimonas sp. MAG313]MDF1879770.1 class I SAM-dependent methyltransferase [Sulfurimonas sp. MAG313]
MIDLFQKQANDWDEQTIPQQLSQTIGPMMLKHLTLDSSMDIMDFGAGTGLLSFHFAPLVKSIAAVDISESMLKELTAKKALQGKVVAYCQDILKKPLSKTFDLIISAMAMHHVEDSTLMLQSFNKHLKTGGHIALADLDLEDGSFHPSDAKGIFHHGFDREAFAQQLKDAGFINLEFFTPHIIQKEGKEFKLFIVIGTKA